MSWKNLPNWLKGGVIGGIICLVPSLLGILCLIIGRLGYIEGEKGLACIYLILLPFGFFTTLLPKTTNFFVGILSSILINFIIGFFIGSIIGSIIRIIKNRLAYTMKGFFVGVIISIMILLFMFLECLFHLGDGLLRCVFSANLISNNGYLWIVFSIIICSFIGFIIGKLKSRRKKKW